MIQQFETQLGRLSRQAMYGKAGLDRALSAMSEIDERLEHIKTALRHFPSIKERTSKELEALELVQWVEEAKTVLTRLKALKDEGGEDFKSEDQIRQLEEYVAQYSKQTERAIITAGGGGEVR